VTLLLDEMKSVEGGFQPSQTFGNIYDTDDLRRQPWFKNFTGRLDETIQKTRDMYPGDN